MEVLIVLIGGLLIAIIVLPFVAVAKASSAVRTAAELDSRVQALERELRGLWPQPDRPAAPQPAPVIETAMVKTRQPEPPPVAPARPRPIPAAPERQPASPPPPRPIETQPAHAETATDWEGFMGAKLFAWIGGFALFLGIAFFVKYSFDHNLVPPEMRVTIGFLAGVGLLIGGLLMKRKENAVTAQTLCATGVLVLYAVTFACRSFYHFPFFGVVPTFLLMTLITAVAFLLAVRLDALVVTVLGIAGGFLTPVLLSTGQDAPLPLFVYIALLDIGLLAVARRKRWSAPPILGAIGTALTQAGWIGAFFIPERYFAGNKILIAMAVFTGFQALFLAAAALAKRKGSPSRELSASALGMGALAMASAFFFLSFQALGNRPALLVGYLFLVDLGLLAFSLLGPGAALVEGIGGLASFIFLGVWTGCYLTNGNLYTALAYFFVFALLHSVAPLILQRYRKTAPPWWSHAFPAFALMLVLYPIFTLSSLSILVWPFVLIANRKSPGSAGETLKV